MKRATFLLLLLLWMLLIFNFSSQNGEASGGLSTKVTNIVLTIAHKKDTIAAPQKKYIEHIIRKLAHFSIYFLGGIIIYSFFNTFSISFRRKLLFTQILGSLYACTDEFHQLFSFGRTASFKDILIDSSGILLSLIIITLFYKLIKSKINLVQAAF